MSVSGERADQSDAHCQQNSVNAFIELEQSGWPYNDRLVWSPIDVLNHDTSFTSFVPFWTQGLLEIPSSIVTW